MIVNQAPLLELLDGKRQFTIPIYQRTYSWEKEHCEQLFDDIKRIGNDAEKLSHFVGSIVYFKPDISPETSVSKSLVIDGQQRLTTVSLLLLAITHFLESNDIAFEDESWEEIKETYLINPHRQDDSRFKLLLTRKDKTTFENLIKHANEDRGSEHMLENGSKHVLDNYNFFKNKLKEEKKEDIQVIYRGIKKLMIIDVALEEDKDDPQLIFESLNSTGLNLTQADLIRNYALMNQPIEYQKMLYENYWYPMEQSFGEEIGSLAGFIRDYLIMKISSTSLPKIDQVYETYKSFRDSEIGFKEIKEALKDLHYYSRFYVRVAAALQKLQKEEDPDIAKKFEELNKLQVETSYPFLLAVYGDYEKGCISKKEFIDIIGLVSNYVFRRAICGIPTNTLNKTFATLYKRIDRETYWESVQAEFLLMDGNKRFPKDAEFTRELQIKDVFNFKLTKYLLESLENWDRKELVNAENCTIEHILPQNENVSSEWQAELGEDWERVKNEYLHTLGNLTLTSYNSELSDRPFSDKKEIFNESPLFLNESVREANTWNEEAIRRRASALAERACTIWKEPTISSERLNQYKK